jgi:hypothetical protein
MTTERSALRRECGIRGLLLGGFLLFFAVSGFGQKRPAATRAIADAVCSFITGRMSLALPQVPTLCVVKNDSPLQYELSVFSPTEVLEGTMRRAWSTALFLTAQTLFFDGALNGTCTFSPTEDKHWFGCQLEVSDSYLSQHQLHYRIWLGNGTKEQMGIPADPSSDIWYLSWWEMLLHEQKTDHPQSKENAESVGEDACKNYVQAIDRHFKSLNKTVPSCTVMLATDANLYLVVDFHDWLDASAANFSFVLGKTVGRALENTGYDGDIIFRSPWMSTNYGEVREYRIFHLNGLEFCFGEIRSGTRDEAHANFLLESRYASTGQTDRYIFSYGQDELVFRNAAVVRIVTKPGDSPLMDLTDGSEWGVPKEAESRCNLDIGREVFISGSSSSKYTSAVASIAGKPCPLNAVFVKGW